MNAATIAQIIWSRKNLMNPYWNLWHLIAHFVTVSWWIWAQVLFSRDDCFLLISLSRKDDSNINKTSPIWFVFGVIMHTHKPFLHSSSSRSVETGSRMARAGVFALGFTSAVLRPCFLPPTVKLKRCLKCHRSHQARKQRLLCGENVRLWQTRSAQVRVYSLKR